MLKPELQDMVSFADGISNIVEAQQRVAESYFRDGSIEGACPPLKAILHIMAYGNYNGKVVEDPGIREMFTLTNMLNSDWYKERLLNKQLGDIALWQKHVEYLREYLKRWTDLGSEEIEAVRSDIDFAGEKLRACKQAEYLKSLKGYIGLDTFVR